MSARARILAAAGRSALAPRPHPGEFAPQPGEVSLARFAAALEAAGGTCDGPIGRAALAGHVAARARGAAGRVVADPAAADLLGPGPWEVARDDAPPQAFADLAVAIARGALAVCENGAVAVPGALARQRAALFLCERLVLLLDARSLVADLHAALRRSVDAAIPGTPFTWIAGPSKTADIEQALVIGAHGPRALHVVAVVP
jgi:L-lactate dehydrogenase complex protein LldG